MNIVSFGHYYLYLSDVTGMFVSTSSLMFVHNVTNRQPVTLSIESLNV